jgi:tetratricopeptide (TPR) repeat protein
VRRSGEARRHLSRAFAAALLFLSLVSPSGAQDRPAPPDSPASRLERLRRDERGSHPPSPAESVSRRLEIAAQYAARGEAGRAAELLREAAAREPDSGEVLARLTLLHLQQGDFEFARATLDEASERSELRLGPAALWNEAAEKFAAAHRVDDAIAAWELVERYGAADPATSARLARARREAAATPGQRLRQGDRFTIYGDAAIGEDVLARVESHLDAEYARQRDLFGGPPLPTPQVVILYSGRKFFSLVSVPDWVSGVFDGKIRVSLEAGSGFTPEVASVLSHELAHAWIRFLSNDRAPGWLHEGFAQWCEGRRLPRRDLKAAFASRPALALGELEANLARRSDFAVARTNYFQALGLVEYLAAARGEGALVCVLRDLGEGASVSEALARETGLSPAELVAKWRAWIDGR